MLAPARLLGLCPAITFAPRLPAANQELRHNNGHLQTQLCCNATQRWGAPGAAAHLANEIVNVITSPTLHDPLSGALWFYVETSLSVQPRLLTTCCQAALVCDNLTWKAAWFPDSHAMLAAAHIIPPHFNMSVAVD